MEILNKILSVLCCLGGVYVFLLFLFSAAGHSPASIGAPFLPIAMFGSVALFYVSVKLWKK